jgi:hypothetical protein
MEEKTERPLVRALRFAETGEDDDYDIEYYFNYLATLRIFGEMVDFEKITRTLGIEPTRQLRKGCLRPTTNKISESDAWFFEVPLAETESLQEHIDYLWRILKPHKDFLLELKKRYTVDVFLGYRSNCDHAGIEVPARSLEMFMELGIPFGLSIIVI